MKNRRGDTLRAGGFVLLGVVVLTFAIFTLGQKSALFTRTTRLYVSFSDISGLTVGTSVRLAGLEIGSVEALSMPSDLALKETRVRLVVQSKYMERIRQDSQAFIDSAGLLGDKIVNISMGDPSFPMLSEGGTLRAGESSSFEAITANADVAVKSLANITRSLDELIQGEETQALPRAASRAATSLANILTRVEHGPGLAHKVVYDTRYADDVQAILANTRALAQKATRAVTRIDSIVAEVEDGQGTLHELVYGADGKRAIAQFANAAQSIDEVVREVEHGNGVLHSLVYEEGNTNFLREFNELSATLNGIVQDIDKGRGTVGGLVRDPTVYEDLKTVLGNVKRNVLFKTLIRFTMEKDDLRRMDQAPKARESAPASSGR